jgi:hypothetical protein
MGKMAEEQQAALLLSSAGMGGFGAMISASVYERVRKVEK